VLDMTVAEFALAVEATDEHNRRAAAETGGE